MVKVKNFFVKIWTWLKNHAPTKRRLIQLYAALLVNANLKGYVTGNIYNGALKNICSPGLNCYSCPGASLACPLGALQDSMSQTNERAAYYIIGILALFGIILARTICGFLCPFGLCQDLIYKVKTPKLRKSRYTRILSYFKYVLLIVLVIAIPVIYQGVPAFCKYVCPAGTFGGAIGLLANESNSSFYTMLGYLFSWKFILLVIFIVGSIFIYRFFCRFFCPLGAIYGFFNKYALIGVKLDSDKCVDCGKCIEKCRMDIRHVGDHECINCGECIPVCPTKAISWKGSQIFLKGIDTEPVPADGAPESEQPNIKAMTVAVADSSMGDGEVERPEEKPAKPAKPLLTKPEKIKKRNFWLKFSAWAAALVVLASSLVYLNFFDKQTSYAVHNVGDRCPDIIVQTYKSKATCNEKGELIIDTFSTIESKGKVIVINFWYTTCFPCVEELPYFEKVRAEFGDEILMVAIHSSTAMPPKGDNGENGVQLFLDKSGWNEYGIIFAQADTEFAFKSLGGRNAYPVTAIINQDGKIAYFQNGTVEENDLREEITKLLN